MRENRQLTKAKSANHDEFYLNNALNQTTQEVVRVLREDGDGSLVPGDSAVTNKFTWSAQGGLLRDGRFIYAFDAEDQLTSVTSSRLTNGAIRVENKYDYRHRRISKTVKVMVDDTPPDSPGAPPLPATHQSWHLKERHDIEQSKSFNPKCDAVEMYSVRTTNDFFRVWKTIGAHSRKKSKRVTRFQVKGLYLYTHSGPGELYLYGTTAQSHQIKRLPRLNWALNAEIGCFGCNSGVEDTAGDSLAGSFYESQKVPTYGQAGYSSFSSNPSSKSKWGVVLRYSDVYLWAFDKDGDRIPPVLYPKKEKDIP